jgi:hypothetical protein
MAHDARLRFAEELSVEARDEYAKPVIVGNVVTPRRLVDVDLGGIQRQHFLAGHGAKADVQHLARPGRKPATVQHRAVGIGDHQAPVAMDLEVGRPLRNP